MRVGGHIVLTAALISRYLTGGERQRGAASQPEERKATVGELEVSICAHGTLEVEDEFGPFDYHPTLYKMTDKQSAFIFMNILTNSSPQRKKNGLSNLV